MRLSKIYQIVSSFNYQVVQLKVSQRQTFKIIGNLIAFKHFINIISETNIFSEEVNILTSSPLYATTLDSIEIANSETDFIKYANTIIDSCKILKTILSRLVEPADQLTISIQLPQPNDFEELTATMSRIKKALYQTLINSNVNGEVIIKRWETGSYWIDIFVGTTLAVHLIASIVWSAAVVCKKFQENKMFAEHARSLKIRSDSLEDLYEKQKVVTSKLIDTEAKNIYYDHFNKDDNNEEIERIKYAVTTFAELIQKGGEIHPSLAAPEKVQNLFPDYKRLEQVVSKTKLLDDGGENDGGEDAS